MKKKVGIIAAMQEEFESIADIMESKDFKEINELTFVTGKIEDCSCVLAQCGVGKVNAARVTQILIDNFPIEFVINVGAAGALNPMLKIGDIVIGEQLVQHDFDITAFGHTKGYITGVGDRIYSDEKLVKEFQMAIKHINDRTYKIDAGTIASGDIFCTDVAMKDKIYAKFDAKCVEMEGAAVAQVCYLDKIPFIVVRSISDSPDGKNEVTFEQYIELASKRCANILKDFLKEISKEKK